MIFKSFKNLVDDIMDVIPLLPRDIGTVVGVPRSGMIPASVLSTMLGARLAVLGDTSTCYGGWRIDNLIKCRGDKILLVDDSSFTGNSILQAKKILDKKCTTLVIYVTSSSKNKLDIYSKITPPDRIFQWNFLAKSLTHTWCFDMDGVICTDPDHFDDDGTGYEKALINAKPLYLPQTKIKAIVTNRIERWRKITMDWLSKHEVDYDELIMQPFETAVERRQKSNSAVFKSEHYLKYTNSKLFIESSEWQAKKINELTGKHVLCTENFIIY